MNAPEQITEQTNAMVVPAHRGGMVDLSPQNFEQALTFANYLAESDLVPKDFRGKPGNCLIAMQWGAEVGLKPLQALQNIAIINGRPAMWGDAVIALVRGSPLCEYVQETDDGRMATCRVKRRGEPEQVRAFSEDDAKAAGLAGKEGPWRTYPKRMRQMRARAYALRDVFPDVLRGIAVAEEVIDILHEKHMGPADVVAPPPAADTRAWTDEKFSARLVAKWQPAVDKGESVNAILQFAEGVGPLTDEQRTKILALKPTAQATPAPTKAPTPSPTAAPGAEPTFGDDTRG